MAKRIAIWGSPGSGKTTLAVKLSDFLSKEHSVVVVFCDRTNPPLPYLFPKHRDKEIKSIGTALSAIDITEEKVMSSATVGENGNIIYLGYAGGENMYSYPSFGIGRANAFMNLVDTLADYVIFDCPSVFVGDAMTEAALKGADCVFRLYNPTLQSFLFFESQLPLMNSEDFKSSSHLKILSRTDNEVPLPESEAVSFMNKCDGRITHRKKIKVQMIEGTLPGTKPGRTYTRDLMKLAKMADPTLAVGKKK